MNGLEQILLKIEEDNQAAVSKIISDAKANAKKLLDESADKAKAESDEIIEEAEKHALQIADNAESGYEATLRRGELQAKAEIVNGWLDKAMTQIKSLDDEAYFSTVFNLILLHADKKSGELIFNDKDRNRLPSNFMTMLNDALENGAELTLSDEAADIENGCIIRYGGIEENCTFNALLEEKADEVKDKLFALVNV